MRITVSLDGVIARYGDLLAAVPDKAKRAFVEGLNEGGDLGFTKVRRSLVDQTGVLRYGAITKRTDKRRASAGNLEYVMRGLGPGMPIKEFPVRAAVRSPVSADPWNVGHTFERSFKTSRLGLLRARRGAERMPIRALYGPAVAKEIIKDQTADTFEGQVAPLIEAAVVKRLGRLLP